jgi:hypothetical protein
MTDNLKLIYKIKMKFHLKSLDSLAGNHKKVLVFDCEFWHVMKKSRDRYFTTVNKENFFFIPREIGGFRLLTALILIEILIGIALDRLIAIKFEKS